MSASAPFGTSENDTIRGKSRGNIYGSKVSPFGTDDNEYISNKPKNDHRQNGKSMNIQVSSAMYRKLDMQETMCIKQPSNSILILREKLVKRGARSWFGFLKTLKM